MGVRRTGWILGVRCERKTYFLKAKKTFILFEVVCFFYLLINVCALSIIKKAKMVYVTSSKHWHNLPWNIIDGSIAEPSLRMSLQDIFHMPSRSVFYPLPHFVSCALKLCELNQRAFFLLVSNWDNPMWSSSRISEERSTNFGYIFPWFQSHSFSQHGPVYTSLSFWILTTLLSKAFTVSFIHLLYTFIPSSFTKSSWVIFVWMCHICYQLIP